MDEAILVLTCPKFYARAQARMEPWPAWLAQGFAGDQSRQLTGGFQTWWYPRTNGHFGFFSRCSKWLPTG